MNNSASENDCVNNSPIINKIFEVGFEKFCEVYQSLVDLFTVKYPELLNEYCRYSP